MVKNDTLQNLSDNAYAINDDLTDGSRVQGPILNREPFKPGTAVTVSLVSMTEDAFYFFTELQVQLNNGGLFSQPPANVRTNFKNITPSSKTRTSGYFFLRSVTKKSMVMK
jgi:hypothetical protein